MKENLPFQLLRVAAMLILWVAAAASLVLTLEAGHKNTSLVLPALFVAWVLSPFIGMFLWYRRSGAYSLRRRIAGYLLILLLAIGYVTGYCGILSPEHTKPAAVFLLVPLVSWCIIIAAIVTGSKLNRQP